MKTQSFQIVNVDTDSCSFCKQDMSPFSEEEQQSLLDEINSMIPELIRFSHDGIYDKFIVIRAKNYVTKGFNKKKQKWEVKIKGSALKGTMKEPKFKQFMSEFLNLLLEGQPEKTIDLYNDYAYQISTIIDIKPWAFRKTVTKTLWTSQRSNETRVWASIQHTMPQEGDKVSLYFNDQGLPQLANEYTGNHDTKRLLDKLRDTLEIFENVIDKSLYPNYSLKKNRQALEDLVNLKSGKEMMSE